jgi:hypothetical protein
MKKIAAERSDITFYVKVAPVLDASPEAQKRARQIVCSQSAEALEKAMEGKPVESPDCPTSEIEENLKFVREHGISGVPAIVLPDGSVSEGFLDAPSLVARIDAAAKNGKSKR